VAVSIEGFMNQWRRFWGGLNTPRKVALFGVSVGVMATLVLLVLWGGRPSYKVLYSQLGREDAAAIVERLRAKRVPYRLQDEGSTILVPDENIYELRLELATEGLPQGGGVGFEIFDRNNFGATEFVQRVNLQRALQGELARTIRQFPQVVQARVHLSMPEESLFVREEKTPKATVVLHLKPGAALQPSQLQGIAHLVASSVQGMEPKDVHIVDTLGKVLYSMADQESWQGVTDSLLDLQGELERRLERKIQGLLEPLVGADHVLARVNVDLDPDRVEQTEERYDPDQVAVRSEQRVSETSSGPAAVVGGIPGVLSNTTEQGGTQATGGQSGYQRQNEIINYELSRLTRRTTSPMGRIRRLTVAVLVDGVRKKVVGQDGKETWQVVPRPASELRQYEEIVKQAVGLDPRRGDQLRVASIPFERMREPAADQAPPAWLERLLQWGSGPLARYGMISLIASLFILLVVRPFVKGFLSALQPSPQPMELPKTVQELEAEPEEARPDGVSLPSQQLVQLAETDPERFALALRAWMRREQ